MGTWASGTYTSSSAAQNVTGRIAVAAESVWVHADAARLEQIVSNEVARRIRSKPDGSDAKLIALTGYGFPQDRERSRTAGFDCHLTKPVQPAHLLREIEASVAWLRNAQERV